MSGPHLGKTALYGVWIERGPPIYGQGTENAAGIPFPLDRIVGIVLIEWCAPARRWHAFSVQVAGVWPPRSLNTG